MSDKRAPGVQDDYEEKLGFHGTFVTVEKAYQSNLSLLKREQKKSWEQENSHCFWEENIW